MAIIAQLLSLFVLAGLCEIGGGYLVWLWLREGKGVLTHYWDQRYWSCMGLFRRFNRPISGASTQHTAGSLSFSLLSGAG